MMTIRAKDPIALLDYFEFVGKLYGKNIEAYPRYENAKNRMRQKEEEEARALAEQQSESKEEDDDVSSRYNSSKKSVYS